MAPEFPVLRFLLSALFLYNIGVCLGEKQYLGPMCPPLMSFAKRRWMRLMSLGRITAPEPRRMERSFVCSFRMRWERETEGILEVLESIVLEWDNRVYT